MDVKKILSEIKETPVKIETIKETGLFAAGTVYRTTYFNGVLIKMKIDDKIYLEIWGRKGLLTKYEWTEENFRDKWRKLTEYGRTFSISNTNIWKLEEL